MSVKLPEAQILAEQMNEGLFGKQIEACHEIGVRCPVYFTVGWSVNDAESHPEWCVRNKDGSFAVTRWDFDAAPDDPRPFGSWKYLCMLLHIMGPDSKNKNMAK